MWELFGRRSPRRAGIISDRPPQDACRRAREAPWLIKRAARPWTVRATARASGASGMAGRIMVILSLFGTRAGGLPRSATISLRLTSGAILPKSVDQPPLHCHGGQSACLDASSHCATSSVSEEVHLRSTSFILSTRSVPRLGFMVILSLSARSNQRCRWKSPAALRERHRASSWS
jgi:hypothetical protein